MASRYVAVLALTVVMVGTACSNPMASDPVYQAVASRPDIYSAARAGDFEQAQAIIADRRWDAGEVGPNKETPLTAAAAGGNVEIIKLMVQMGAPIDRPDGNKRTPLQAAQKAGKKDAVETLKELGATE